MFRSVSCKWIILNDGFNRIGKVKWWCLKIDGSPRARRDIPAICFWELNPQTCPPDLDFIEYLENDMPRDICIFHMGCGLHHTVGLWAARNNAYVRSISITPAEIEEYMRLATNDPNLNNHYLVDFGDIHLYPLALLPNFNYVTLFHLGEISEHSYPGYTMLEVVIHLTNRLFKGGKIFFFNRSVAWKKIENSIYSYLSETLHWEMSTYKSLVIYQQSE